MRKPREVKFEWWVKLYKCSSCWEFLPRERYSQNLSWYDFIASECKKCNTIRIKKYRSENKDKRNEYQRNYKAKRRMMMEAQFWEWYKVVPIPEPTYPQPWPQPIPEPTYPQPWPQPIPAVQPKGLSAHQSQSDWVWEPKKVVVNFEEVVPLTFSNNEEVVPLTFSNDDELIIQSAIEKYPDAYTEILWDEDTLYYFNEKRSTDKKIEELQRRQEKFDKLRAEKEYNIMKEKMRDLVDETLSDSEKIRFEDKLHSLHEEQQDDFVKKVSKLSKVSFPVSREAIFDALLDKQTGKNNNKETTEFTL